MRVSVTGLLQGPEAPFPDKRTLLSDKECRFLPSDPSRNVSDHPRKTRKRTLLPSHQHCLVTDPLLINTVWLYIPFSSTLSGHRSPSHHHGLVTDPLLIITVWSQIPLPSSSLSGHRSSSHYTVWFQIPFSSSLSGYKSPSHQHCLVTDPLLIILSGSKSPSHQHCLVTGKLIESETLMRT
jgi:predicted nucleic acid-binding Zn ribbon protein